MESRPAAILLLKSSIFLLSMWSGLILKNSKDQIHIQKGKKKGCYKNRDGCEGSSPFHK